MKRIVLPAPTARQREFLRAREKYVAFGGARGGGKSHAVRTKAVLLCLAHPGIKCMIVRRTYPELQENHILPICEWLNVGKRGAVATYHDSKKYIRFRNGSRILFRYCDSDADAERFQGTEVDVLFIDEATHQTEERVKRLFACVRGVGDYPRRVYLTCNPGGVGHAWVKRLFIDRRYHEGENGEEYRFIPSRVTDNLPLMRADPDYVRQLEALPPKLRRAWLEGDWNVFEGQFFEELTDRPVHYLDRTFTHVIEPFTPHPDWRIYRSFDWGYAKPFSCGWWAVDEGGTAYRILEYYGCNGNPNEGVKMPPSAVFREIARIEREHPWLAGKQIFGVADPAIWNAESGKSIAEVAEECGVYFDKGDHARIPGWMQVHYRLAFDAEGRPAMYVFRGCEAFLRTMPALVYDKSRPEDLDTAGEDHVADEVRYFCMARPVPPRGGVAVAKTPPVSGPLSLGALAPRRVVQRMEILGRG